MRTLLIAAAAGVALFATAATAQDAPSWYVTGNTGATFGSHMGDGPHNNTGWTVSGGVGRDFGNGFRAEGEALYLDGAGRRHGADTSAVAGLLNGYYGWNLHGAWQPFIGGGVGAADVRLDGDGAQHGDSTNFAYQAIVGMAHPFNDRLTGEVKYRYLGVTDTRFGAVANRIGGDYQTSMVTIGFRYRFGH